MKVVLITVDALRADHLPCYGYGRETAPFLSGSLADRSAWFTSVYATSSSTAASVPGILASSYPLDHGGYNRLSRERPLLSSAFRDAGFATAAVHTNVNFTPTRNYDRGFDHVYSVEDETDPGYRLRKRGKQLAGSLVEDTPLETVAERVYGRYKRSVQRVESPDESAETVLGEARRWLDGRRGEDAFLWVHLMDAHNPFQPPAELRDRFYDGTIDAETAWSINDRYSWDADVYTEEELDQMRALYDGCIRYLDGQLASFVRELHDAEDDTVLAVTSDHGELFGEQGLVGHGYCFDEALLRVPLFVSGPDVEPGRRGGLASTVDVGPTLLELADVPVPDGSRGAPLDVTGHRDASRELCLAEGCFGDSQARSHDRDRWRIWVTDGSDHVVHHVATGSYTEEVYWMSFDADTGDWIDHEVADTPASAVPEHLRDHIEERVESVDSQESDVFEGAVDLGDRVEEQLEQLGYR